MAPVLWCFDLSQHKPSSSSAAICSTWQLIIAAVTCEVRVYTQRRCGDSLRGTEQRRCRLFISNMSNLRGWGLSLATWREALGLVLSIHTHRTLIGVGRHEQPREGCKRAQGASDIEGLSASSKGTGPFLVTLTGPTSMDAPMGVTCQQLLCHLCCHWKEHL